MMRTERPRADGSTTIIRQLAQGRHRRRWWQRPQSDQGGIPATADDLLGATVRRVPSLPLSNRGRGRDPGVELSRAGLQVAQGAVAQRAKGSSLSASIHCSTAMVKASIPSSAPSRAVNASTPGDAARTDRAFGDFLAMIGIA